MTNNATSQPQRIRERLAGHHILVTGSTGFLAKAFVEKLLRAVNTIGGVHLLVRARSDGTSPRQRVMREVLGSRAYDRLRASLGEGFSKLCQEKIHVVGGDLTKERLGLDRAAYDALTRRITLVINSAATVTFDERLDLAVELNALGPKRLLQFADDCGAVPLMHVSTCYVCGARRGTIGEDFSAPESAENALPRLEDGTYDLDGLIEAMRAEAAELRHRFGADTETCRRHLIEAGMRRARSYGWNDTYTFTKWIGEQILVRDRGNVPLVVFRPAIIEGSFEEPTPGWIDGLRMADPIIMAFGRGRLGEFPARPDIALDLIPVDFVANAMIATLPVGDGWEKELAVYHCASSGRNPFLLKDVGKALERAFRRQPIRGEDGRPLRPGSFQLVDQHYFMARWEGRRRKIARLQKALWALGVRGRRYRRLSSALRQVDQLIYFARIYSPYTHLDCRFSDDSLRAAGDKLHPEDRSVFPFDVTRIDWDDYLVNRHVPGLRTFVLGAAGEPAPRILAADDWEEGGKATCAEALCGANLFDVFRRAAERFGNKPALQIRREGGQWVTYTYEDALRATGMIMRRFLERGLKPGDRVAICGENGPEWGLTYLAAMRAGLTAVPLDPQLPPEEAWDAARFAEAKLMCVTPATHPALSAHRGEDDPEPVVMREPFIPRPGASRDSVPDPVPVDDSAVASILFTSGTTVSPKAVRLTHRNLIANARALVRVHSVGPADELLSVLPLYHVFEFTGGFVIPLVSGATITYVERLNGHDIIAAMQATGTTIMLVVPRVLRLFQDAIENSVSSSGVFTRVMFRLINLASRMTGGRFGRQLFKSVHRRFGGRLRMFVSGGSRLDPELFDAFTRMGFEVYEGYGLTETAPVVTVNPPGRARRGAVGPPLPGVELQVRNRNLEGIGEVWVRGENVMPGYLKNPEATAEVLVDGWFRTGDLGRCDADGYLVLTGRSTDLIVTGAGKNVYPDEVEARYRDLPYVTELCVFGLPSEDGLGDTVHAVVVAEPEAATGLDRSSVEREIRAAVTSIGESLPSHQRIAVLHFWERELPKTSTQKAKRNLIREMVVRERAALAARSSQMPTEGEGAEEPQPALSFTSQNKAAAFAAIRRILARSSRRPEKSITRNMHLHLDLGIDSIGKMDVLGAMEAQFGISINGETAAKVARVSDLLVVVGDRKPKKDAPRIAASWPKRLREPEEPARVDGRFPAALLPVRWLVRGGVAVFMNSYVRVRVKGRENIPATGPFILAPNHSSHLDSPSVLTAVGGKRRVWVAGAEDYFFDTAFKRLLFGKLLDTIPFDRHCDGILGLRRCGEALRRGDGLLIFPEGTRSTTGRLQPFKEGAAMLAAQHKAPIVPVYIDRAGELLAKGRRFVKPGTITVTFGKPIMPPDPDESADWRAILAETTRHIQADVAALADGVKS